MGNPFGTGGDEAEKASRGGFAGTRYFSLEKSGDKAIVRLLTEQPDWPYTSQHGFLPTKSAPADLKEGQTWPKQMPAICRNDPKLVANLPGYGDCYIDSAPQFQGKDKWGKKISKTTTRVWALCCLREEVREDGKTVGYKDKLIEVKDKDGNTKLVRDIQVINMSTKNFFGHFTGMYHVYGTVRDRDYVVTRKGADKDTDYAPVPLDKIPDHVPGSESWAAYDEALKDQDIDLVKIMLERCSKEYFEKFFIPGAGESAAKAENTEAAESAAEEPQDTPPPSPERISGIRDRIKSYRPDEDADKADAES
jgi:hypothetical protein